jgi:hypothetical protein
MKNLKNLKISKYLIKILFNKNIYKLIFARKILKYQI